jgi:hypothetical protein
MCRSASAVNASSDWLAANSRTSVISSLVITYTWPHNADSDNVSFARHKLLIVPAVKQPGFLESAAPQPAHGRSRLDMQEQSVTSRREAVTSRMRVHQRSSPVMCGVLVAGRREGSQARRPRYLRLDTTRTHPSAGLGG